MTSAEENLSDAYLAAIVASSDDAIVGKTLDGIIQSWNGAAERMFGYTAGEAIGRHISLIIPPDRIEEEAQIIAHIKKGERVDHFETVRRAKDGRLIDIAVTVSPIRTADGRIIGASKTARDVTEHKRLTAELLRSNEELEKFAHVAAHDLKAPLRSIDNLAIWIIEDNKDKLNSESQEMLATLRGRVGRLERLLDDILNYSRAGTFVESVSKINLEEFVAEVVQTHVPPAFTVRVEPLPTILSPATPLRQIFGNLLSNAVKHHDRGGGVIAISSRPCGSFYEFAVSDDGPGIPPEAHDRVFQMFQTLRPRDKVEGSGIGMALVKKLVERHKGKVWIKSEAGQRGTAVHFLWPAEPQVVPTLPNERQQVKNAGS
jgi:two-component system sensor kinase FixL